VNDRPNILLDMDGVLVDFVEGAILACGASVEECYRKWTPGLYDVVKVLGIGEEEFWRKVESKGEDFWAHLRQYPWSRSLYDGCSEFGEVFFLTKPTLDPKSCSGKVRWMQAFLGGRLAARNYLLGPPKYLCAKPWNILVDDCEPNVDLFAAAGGKAILFPQVWNRRHAQANSLRCERMLCEVEEVIRGLPARLGP
jgi:5'(3')-deoxyribonucleotidase